MTRKALAITQGYVQSTWFQNKY